ncbi:MAG TPA: hypothetical protein VE053_09630 [Allosphingosinicella sp.]|nr:hypothetical protein [Allosphingosinicella sp.]
MTKGIGYALLMAGSALAAPAAAIAAETIGYRYDARGRLIEVVRTGAVNNHTVAYGFDKADNRIAASVAATAGPGPGPAKGYKIIPVVPQAGSPPMGVIVAPDRG